MSRIPIKSLNIPIFSQEYATEAFRNTTYEEGVSDGMAQGMAQGVSQGRLEGKLAQAINTIRNLLRLGKLSDDDIAASVSMPVEEVRKIKAEMQ